MSDVMTKQQLIDALRSSGERVASTLASVSSEDLDRGLRVVQARPVAAHFDRGVGRLRDGVVDGDGRR